MKRLAGVCFLIILVSLAAGSCGYNENLNDVTDEGEDITIGFSMATLLEDRWVRDRDMFAEQAKKKGLSVIFTNANKDSELQLDQVGELLEQNIDVLVLAPVDSEKAVDCVTAAQQKGVPVIAYDRLPYKSNVDAYVSFDNFMIGDLMGKALLEAVPNGGYLLVKGSSNDNNSSTVAEGIMNVLGPGIAAGDIEILAETWIEGWVREDAYEYTAESIKKFGDRINAVACGNDSLACGVMEALAEAQVSGGVQVVGQDADLVNCRKIVQGQQLMTVYKPIEKLVESAAELCLAIVNGDEIEFTQTISDGQYDVPFISCDVIAVTKDNLDDTVIKDGFHLEEDVYRTAGISDK